MNFKRTIPGDAAEPGGRSSSRMMGSTSGSGWYRVALFFALFLFLACPVSLEAQDCGIGDRLFGAWDARELLDEGKYDQARDEFRDYMERCPGRENRSVAMYGIARSYDLQDQHDTAARYYLKSLDRAQDLQKHRGTALERGLYTTLRSGNHRLGKKFLEIIRTARNQNTPVPEGGYRQAVTFLEQIGQSGVALQWSRARLQQNPDDPYWMYETALLLVEQKQYDDAMELLFQLQNGQSSYRWDALHLAAEIELEKGNLRVAESRYQRLLQNPDHRWKGHYGLAWIYLKRDQYQQARDEFQKVAQNATGNMRSKAARDLARLAREKDDEETVRTWYGRSVEWAEEPLRSKLLIEYGDYLSGKGELARAVTMYSNAGQRPRESAQHLIEAYVRHGRYRNAEQQLRSALDRGLVEGPRWERLLALSVYRQGRLEEALSLLPDPSRTADSSEKKSIWALEGRIHFDRKQWEQARRTYREWQKALGGDEPRYFLGLVARNQDRTERARSIWSSLLADQPDEPWRSRAAFQLARMAAHKKNWDEYERWSRVVSPGTLPDSLRGAYWFLEMDRALARGEYGEQARRITRRARNHAEKTGQLSNWYGHLIQHPIPGSWWESIALPVLRQEQDVRRKWGVSTLQSLRSQGRMQTARRVGNELLSAVDDPALDRTMRAEHLQTLYEIGDLEALKRAFPPSSQWKQWTGQNARNLAYYLSRYYQDTGNFEQGLQSLDQLNEQLADVPQKLRWDLQEWMATFEIRLERFFSARVRLAGLEKKVELSRTGELNLAIADYYQGFPEDSLWRIRRLHKRWDTAPVEVYDFGFRLLRGKGEGETLVRWSRELMNREDISDSVARPLLLKNVRYWVNSERTDVALEFLDRIEQRTPDRRDLVPVFYYRGLAYFNRGDLDQAVTWFDRLQNRFELNNTWAYRVVRTRIETHLRQSDWTAAYNQWRTLHGMGRGGEVGTRLLGSMGLEQSPANMESLLRTLRESYEEFLTEEQAVYWEARILDRRNRPREAARAYRTYLDKGFEENATTVRIRLASLYHDLGDHQEAFQLYDTLYQNTEDPEFLVRRAIESRQLNQLEQARSDLRTALADWPERRAWVHYELGRTLQLQSQYGPSADHYEQALDRARGDEFWIRAARVGLTQTSLQTNRVPLAESQITLLDTGPEKLLLEAELRRQQGSMDRALKALRAYEELYPDTAASSPRFQQLAVAVYWQTESYGELIRVLPPVPESSDHQLRLLVALVRTGRVDRARTLYEKIDQSVRTDAERVLAEHYYANQQWSDAITFYQKLEPDTRTLYRQARAHLENNQNRKAFSALKRVLESTGNRSLGEWQQPVLSLLTRVSQQLDRKVEAARLLDQHWDRLDAPDTVARLAMTWSLNETKWDLVERFIPRVQRIDPPLFESVAHQLESARRTELIGQWVKHYESSAGVPSPAPLPVVYYRARVKIRESPDDSLIEDLNRALDRAVEKNSPYAPRFQRLLGDFYYYQENFEQAAVEYYKVKLLFDDNTVWPQAGLRLARSYEKLGKSDRARTIYRSLQADTMPEDVRREARQWINSNT